MSTESNPAKLGSDLNAMPDPMATLAPGSADGFGTEQPNTAGPSGRPPLSDPSTLKIAGYRVIREISRGGQAIVFEAIQLATSRRVAIKVLREGPFASPQGRARLEREVLVLAALDHPDIVQVLDKGVAADGSFFLVMPFLTGRPLDQYWDSYHQRGSETAKDPAELMRLFLRICDAVNAAHLRGVVHRDLKPNNIQVDENGNPHILDFGLARTAVPTTDEDGNRDMTISGEFLGSLPWASPEQADGLSSKIDTRTDVYSLGVILYQSLTGQFPYEVVGTMRDVLNNILTARPMPPSQVLAAREAKEVARLRKLRTKHLPMVNPVIEAIVLKALNKRREDRYQTAGEFARDIANYLAGRPTLAAGARSSNPGQRRALIAVAAIAVVALAVVLALPLRPRHVAPAGATSEHAAPTAAPIQSALPVAVRPIAPVAEDYPALVKRLPGLLGYWRFSSSLNSDVNGYLATAQGGASIVPEGSGPILGDNARNAALWFPVGGAGAAAPSVRTDLVGEIADEGTILCWCYLDALPSDEHHTFYIAGESEFRNDFDLYIDGDNHLKFFTDNGTSTVSPIRLQRSDVHVWHFLAATFLAHHDRALYMDGKEVAVKPCGAHETSKTAPFCIASAISSPASFFVGRIAEVALYQRALSGDEIASLYNAAKPAH